MSRQFRETGKIEVLDFGESRTKQSFKDSTDINKILKKAQVTGSISHLNVNEASFGEFAGHDLMEQMHRLERAQVLFDGLPSEVRNEFANEPSAFFEFVNHPDNVDRLAELLPLIAEPGQYFPDVSSRTPPGELLNAEIEPSSIEEKEVIDEPK